ncbi:MAG: hypothetical protein ACTJLK_02015 [Anaplasma sp.]
MYFKIQKARIAWTLTCISCLLLSSCTIFKARPRIVYESPTTKEGRECVAQCVYTRSNCYRQCQDQSRACKISEMERSSLSKYVDNVVDIFGNLISSHKARDGRYACEIKKSACRSKCGSDGLCVSKCEAQFHCNDIPTGTLMFGTRPSSKQEKKDICCPNMCYGLCGTDYDVCFEMCGGRIYEEQPESSSD